MAVSATQLTVWNLCLSEIHHLQYQQRLKLNPSRKLLGIPWYVFGNPFGLCTRKSDSCFIIRAQDPQRNKAEESSSIDKNTSASTFQVQAESFPIFEFDGSKKIIRMLFVLYVGGFRICIEIGGGGSIVGAAAIKYGSALFPEITRPNIVLALTMISTPVLVAVLLLIKESRLVRGE